MARTSTSHDGDNGHAVPRDRALDHLETEMAVLIRRLEHNSRRASTEQELDRSGYLLARTIDASGPISVNQLAQLLELDGSTVTRQVTPLVERGFVDRTSDPTDRRAIVLTLTAAGRREMEATRITRVKGLEQIVTEWPSDDVAMLAALLERLNGTLISPRPSLPDAAPPP